MNTYKLKQNTKKLKQIGEDYVENLSDPDVKAANEKALQDEKQAAADMIASNGLLLQRLIAVEDHETAKQSQLDAELQSSYRMIKSASGSAKMNWKVRCASLHLHVWSSVSAVVPKLKLIHTDLGFIYVIDSMGCM